jgi:hypothetical protein
MTNKNTLYIFHDKNYPNIKSTFKNHRIKTYDYKKNISTTFCDWENKNKEKLEINNLYWTVRHAREVEEFTYVTVVQNPKPQSVTMAKLILDNTRECIYEVSFDKKDKIRQYKEALFSIKQIVERNAFEKHSSYLKYNQDDIEKITPLSKEILVIFTAYNKAQEEFKAALNDLREDFSEKFEKYFKR